MAITEYQERVYSLLLQIPTGKVSSYAALSRALVSSPRAVGGALRRNPYAPQVPCHRIICADGVSDGVPGRWFRRADQILQAIGGFKGEAQDAPSGINQKEKLELLRTEGVVFDTEGFLVDKRHWWDGFDAGVLLTKSELVRLYKNTEPRGN